MRRLRRLGCGVALDDFGTGLSSLSYLRQLPVTMLKIDGSFVRDVLKDQRAESMVRAIAQLARSMSITTVAEYVETEEIRDAHRRRSASTTARASPSAAPSRSRICSPSCRCRARPRTRRPNEDGDVGPVRRGVALMRREPAAPSAIRVTGVRARAVLPHRGSDHMKTRPRTLLALVAGVDSRLRRCRSPAACSPTAARRAPARRCAQTPRAGLPWQEASLFAEVYERIKREYVDDVDDHALMEKAVRGMVAALDPHSAYLDSRGIRRDPPLHHGLLPGRRHRGGGRGRRGEDPAPDRRLAGAAGRAPAGRPDRAHRRHRHRRGPRRRHLAHARRLGEPGEARHPPRRRAPASPSSPCAAPRSRCTACIAADPRAGLRLPAHHELQRDHGRGRRPGRFAPPARQS